MQQGDVRLFQTNDNGNISVDGGIVAMDGGLNTSVYLSLFGGNYDDSGAADDIQWWGNIDETVTDSKQRSETQFLLHSIPAIPANLLRIKDAVNRDLAWMISSKAAESINVLVSMPGVNLVDIMITINGNDTLKFSENWRSN